jgi:hypothetical protein
MTMAKFIDADKLLAEAKDLSGPITGDGWYNFGVYSLIERQPAADVRENVRGEWINVPNGAMQAWKRQCSVCKTYGRGIKNFCPNCGADMRRNDNVTEKAIEKAKAEVTLGIIGSDPDVRRLMERLIDNGCPVDAILKTVADYAKDVDHE